MSRLPSLTALRAFDAAARHGSFKAAASEIAVSPTAVSHQIRSLEEQIGIALFIRKVRKIELTEAGKALASATSNAFQEIQSALDNLVDTERTLTVTTTPAFASLWLVPRIAGFEKLFPDIKVHIDTTTTVIDLSRDRRIDIAIRYGNGSYENMAVTKLISEEMVAVAAPDYLEQLDSFQDASLIQTSWQSSSLQPITWNTWCDVAGIQRPGKKQVREFDQEQHVIQAGLSGQGIILISTVLVADMISKGWLEIYKPEFSIEGLSYFAVTNRALGSTLKAKLFVDWAMLQMSD